MKTMSAREKRWKKMQERGYMESTPFRREANFLKGIEKIKNLASELDSEAKRVLIKGGRNSSYE